MKIEEFLRGKKFNKLTVLSEKYKVPDKPYWYVDVVCDCGVETTIPRKCLTGSRPTKSCGCLQRETLRKLRVNPATIGETFSRLTVTEDLGTGPSGRRVLASCSCDGNVKEYLISSLRNGNTNSCGCYGAEQRLISNTSHGLSGTGTYSSWQNMKTRCLKEKHPTYKKYGAVGISVTPEWLDFETFVRDMGMKPHESYDIDRVDNRKGYSKENCRWVERTVGNHNRRKFESPEHYSPFKGVGFCEKSVNKWTSRLIMGGGGEVVFRENFPTELGAAIAYDEASFRYYGDRPNMELIEEYKLKEKDLI